MQFPYNVYKTRMNDHEFWVAVSSILKGCVGQGDSIDDAVHELEENEKAWIEVAEECDVVIPVVPIEPMKFM